MKLALECLPCALRQIVEAGRILALCNETTGQMMDRALDVLRDRNDDLPAPLMGRAIHRIIREELGAEDPYLAPKTKATEQALALLPAIEEHVRAASDPLAAALRISIAGNAIDLGIPDASEITPVEVLAQAEKAVLDGAVIRTLREQLAPAKSVLFLADNAGELVLDRPLLEQIGADRVTVGVRGSPTINDATREDARRSGLLERFAVIDNGADIPGTWLQACSSEFVQAFESADVVIAKGQGNYETLTEYPRGAFLLLRVKCQAVAHELNLPMGSFVVARHEPAAETLDKAVQRNVDSSL